MIITIISIFALSINNDERLAGKYEELLL